MFVETGMKREFRQNLGGMPDATAVGTVEHPFFFKRAQVLPYRDRADLHGIAQFFDGNPSLVLQLL
jgi:hypothetical protein